MEEYAMTLVWAAMFVAAIVIEATTSELVAVWFIPGIVVAIVLSLFGVPEWIQCLVCAAMSAVLLFLALKVFRKKILKNHGRGKTDTDLLIGADAKVVEEIDNEAMSGAVKIDGKIWTARMADDGERAEIGEFVTVESISGVKLICRRK